MDAEKKPELKDAMGFLVMVATAPSKEAIAERTIDLCGSRSDAITTLENAARLFKDRGFDTSKFTEAKWVIERQDQDDLSAARSKEWDKEDLTDRERGLLNGYQSGYSAGLGEDYDTPHPDDDSPEYYDGFWCGFRIGGWES